MTHACTRTGPPLNLSKHTSSGESSVTFWDFDFSDTVAKVWGVWPMCVELTSPSLLEQTHLSGGTQVSLHHTYISTTVISYMRQPYTCAPCYPPTYNPNSGDIQQRVHSREKRTVQWSCLSKRVFRFQLWPVWLWFCPSGHSEKSYDGDTQRPV